MRYNILIVFLFIGIFSQSFAQNLAKDSISTYQYNKNKGKFFVNWGGNRGFFTKSDIHFKGDNYDFTMYDVKSHDKPKGWHIDYINPKRVTIPQTNFKMGYFFKDHYIISLGLDHMKYVFTQPQLVKIDGAVNLKEDEGNTNFNGNYDNSYLQLNGEKDDQGHFTFFHFEHTDGLNFIFAEVSRIDNIGKCFKLNPDTLKINIFEGIGAGGLYPKTNATVFGKARNDEFHWSGYGVNLTGGVNLVLFKHIQINTEVKGGYINMPWIKTTVDGDSASQSFWFFEHNITFGYVFQLFN